MSNRRRVPPPRSVVEYARSYRCTDCHSQAGRPHRDQHGLWRVLIHHEDSCPVLNSQVSVRDAGIAAAEQVARSLGESALYVQLGPSNSERDRERDGTAVQAYREQADQAARELRGKALRSSGKTAADGTLRKGHPLTLLIEQKMSEALDAGRVCPHLQRGPRPAFLDPYRAILHCGRCMLPEQLEPLPGDEEFCCDLCHRLTTEDEPWSALQVQTDFVMTAFALCPECLVRAEVEFR